MNGCRRRLAAVLSGLLLAGCTADAPQVIECDDSTAAVTTAERIGETIETTETTAETTSPSSAEEAFFTVLDNPGHLRFELYSMRTNNMRCYPYSDRLAFYLLYEQDEKGYYFIRLEKHTAKEDGMDVQMMELYERCDAFQLPDTFAWTDTGFVLTGRDTMVNVTVSDTQFGISLLPPAATYTGFARSPDGKYTAYMQRVKTADGFDTDAGSICLRDTAGNVTKIFTNRGIWDENGVYHAELDQPGADTLTAEVVGFMDETHLLCSLSAGGFSGGAAIYDTESGTWSEHRSAWSIQALHDGAAYLMETDAQHSQRVTLWRLDADGSMSCLLSSENPADVPGLAEGKVGVRFTGGMWIFSPYTAENGDILYFYSADMRTHLATVRFAMLSEKDRMYHFHTETVVGHTVLIGFDGEELSDDPMPPPSERSFPVSDYSENSLLIVRDDGTLNITAAHTGTEWHTDFRYDERYVLVFCYDIARDKDGNRTGTPTSTRLKLLDITRGGFVDDIPLPVQDYLHGCTYSDGAGCMLYNSGEVWQITVSDGKLSAEPLPMDGYRIAQMEKNGRYITSPDGKLRAADAGENTAADAGIILRDAAGEFHQICTDVNGQNAQTSRRHTVLGFLDNTHLAYSVSGYESVLGWGIYDTETQTHVTGSGTAVGVHDGYLYAYDAADYMPHTLKRISADGTAVILAEKSDAPQTLFPGKSGWYYRMYTMQNGLWIIMAYEDITNDGFHYNNTHTYIYSADAQTLSAEILVGYKTDSGSDFWYTDGENLVIVKP